MTLVLRPHVTVVSITFNNSILFGNLAPLISVPQLCLHRWSWQPALRSAAIPLQGYLTFPCDRCEGHPERDASDHTTLPILAFA
jgi:hypothetical protein